LSPTSLLRSEAPGPGCIRRVATGFTCRTRFVALVALDIFSTGTFTVPPMQDSLG
jgi:hypothetical protein